jgi:hypothetical protein
MGGETFRQPSLKLLRISARAWPTSQFHSPIVLLSSRWDEDRVRCRDGCNEYCDQIHEYISSVSIGNRRCEYPSNNNSIAMFIVLNGPREYDLIGTPGARAAHQVIRRGNLKMPMLQTTNTDTGRGNVLGLTNTQNQQRVSVFIPTAFAKDTALAGPAAGVYVAIAAGNVEITQASARLLPEALTEHLKASLPAIARNPFNAFRKATGDFYAGSESIRVDLSTPTPETPATRPIRDRAVKLFDAASPSGKMEMATQEFELEQLSGLVAAGALSALQVDAATFVMDRFLALRFAARQGVAAKYPVRETATNPVAIGVAQDAMMQEANAFVAAMKANARTVEQAIQICRDVITWLSIACQCGTDEAFAMLTAPKNAN